MISLVDFLNCNKRHVCYEWLLIQLYWKYIDFLPFSITEMIKHFNYDVQMIQKIRKTYNICSKLNIFLLVFITSVVMGVLQGLILFVSGLNTIYNNTLMVMCKAQFRQGKIIIKWDCCCKNTCINLLQVLFGSIEINCQRNQKLISI